MARDFHFYVDRATEAFECGFTTLSAQKDALADLNSAYERLRDVMMQACLAAYRGGGTDARQPVLDALYWGLPSHPHQWRAKHAQLARDAFGTQFDTEIERVEQVVELRAAIKAAEIIRAERKNTELDERVATVRESLADLMQRRGEQYAHAVKLGEVFGKMPVTANTHWVINEHGHGFWRTFWYLDGELTPLNVLVAAHQELERRKAA